MYKKLVVLLAVSSLLSACSLKEDVDTMKKATTDMDRTTKTMSEQTGELNEKTTEMKNTTKEMAKTTEEMNQRTSEMADTTKSMNTTTKEMNQRTKELKEVSDGIKDNIEELYDAMRQGDAMKLRAERIQSMLSSGHVGQDLADAGKYFMSFEFQLWTAKNLDAGDRRDQLSFYAAQEFFMDMQRFINKDREVNPLAQGESKEDRNHRVANAMAAALHIINPKQENQLKLLQGVKPRSMLSLIQRALDYKKLVDSGDARLSDAPAYITEILAFERDAIYFLQARHNYLALLSMEKMFELSRKKKLSLAKILASDLQIDAKSIGLGEVLKSIESLEMALDTAKYVQGLEVPLQGRGLMLRMLKNLRIYNTQSLSEEHVEAVKKFESLRDEYLKLLHRS